MTQVATTTTKQLSPVDQAIMKAKKTFTAYFGEEAGKMYAREMGFVNEAIKKNPILGRDPVGLESACRVLALSGLSLNPFLKQCALIPRGGKTVLDIQYQGMAQLIYEENGITINVCTVHSCDYEIEVIEGMHRNLIHRPNPEEQTDQNLIGAYVVWTFPDGRKDFYYMPLKRLHEARARSASYQYAMKKGTQNSPWITDFRSMCEKTPLRRASNWIPMGVRSKAAIATIDEEMKETEIQVEEEPLPTE